MFSKFELVGGVLSILFIAMALYVVQLQSKTASLQDAAQQTAQLPQTGVVVAGEENEITPEVVEPNITSMKIDDVKIGTGPAVESGNTVSVHYVGTLQDGTEFDASKKRGQPFEFTVGAGQVIVGWEEGVEGMQVGGERVLVIPPEKAYGAAGAGGVIPPDATLVFTIELLEIR